MFEKITDPKVLSWVTIAALVVALCQAWNARSYRKQMNELKSAVTSFEYLKKHGLELFRLKKYGDSLDTFKKYFMDNQDANDLHRLINTVFWEETTNLYGENIGNTDVLIVKLMKTADGDLKEYNELIIGLIDLYQEKFKSNMPYFAIPYHLSKRNYKNVSQYANSYSAFSGKKETSKCFGLLLKEYCKEKGFVDGSIYTEIGDSEK